MTNLFRFEKIILIDDDIFLNFKHQKILSNIGFNGEVIVFNNGYQAMNYINVEILFNTGFNLIPTLIIMDLEMPVLNGQDFLKIFEALDPGLTSNFYVVICSNSLIYLDFNMDTEFKSVKEYIPKPLSLDTINRLIKCEIV